MEDHVNDIFERYRQLDYSKGKSNYRDKEMKKNSIKF